MGSPAPAPAPRRPARGAFVVQRGAVVLSGRAAWLTAQAVDATLGQLRRQGLDVDPELLDAHAALVEAASAWREGETFRPRPVGMPPPSNSVTLADMTTASVARLLGISDRAVRARAQRGTLAGHRVDRAWRFSPAEIEAVMAREES